MVTATADITQVSTPITQKRLKPRYEQFINEYLLTKNASLSAKNVGYTGKNLHVMGYKLLHKPEIKAVIDAHYARENEKITDKIEEVAKAREISREKYTETAWKEFETLDKTEANAPRYMEIAGKALGYIGTSNDSRPTQAIQINIDMRTMSDNDKLSALRSLLDA